MIDLANLMDRISAGAAALTGGAGRGVATGDSFAALVRFAADSAPAATQPGLRLVVDNDAATDPATLAPGGDGADPMSGVDMVPATILAPVTPVAPDGPPAAALMPDKTGLPVRQPALRAHMPAPVAADGDEADEIGAGEIEAATDGAAPAGDAPPATPEDADAPAIAPAIQTADLIVANQPAPAADMPPGAPASGQPVRPARIIRPGPSADAPAPVMAAAPDTPVQTDQTIPADPAAEPLPAPLAAAPQQPVRPARVLRAGPDGLPAPIAAHQPGEADRIAAPMPAPDRPAPEQAVAPQPAQARPGSAPAGPAVAADADDPAAIATGTSGTAPDTVTGDSQGRERLRAALAAMRVGGRLMTSTPDATAHPAAPVPRHTADDTALATATATGIAGTDARRTAAPDPAAIGGTAVPANLPQDPAVAGTATVPGGAAAPIAGGSAAGANTAEALGDRVIDMGVSGQWIDRMAREISALAQGGGHSRFTLNPPHLGRLDVEVGLDGGLANIRMTAETDEAAQRLSDARPALQADSRIGALAIGSFTVEKAHGQSDTARDPRGDQFTGQGQQQHNASGQGQGQGQGQPGGRFAGEQPRGDWVNRFAREETNGQAGEGAGAPQAAQDSGASRVRFA